MKVEYYSGPTTDNLYVDIRITAGEIQDIPIPNYKALATQLAKAEDSGRTSEVLRAFADMARTIENIEDGDKGRT